MAGSSTVLGIDAGSISLSLVQISENKEILKSEYISHEGRIQETLESVLSNFDLTSVTGVALTSSTPEICTHNKKYDNRVATITAAKHLNGEVGSLLIIGGEKFGLVSFNENGQYKNFRSNTSCAAGTGSFLDQQSKRLGLNSIEEFSSLALNHDSEFPKIASRCAVFAKTDLIHAQQEGYTRESICDGLSYGLAKNIVDALFKNANPVTPLVVAGGVARNLSVIHHLESILNITCTIDRYAHLYGAYGVAIRLLDDNLELSSPKNLSWIGSKNIEKKYAYKPLTLVQSQYPNFSSLNRFIHTSKDFKKMIPVEVDIYEILGKNRKVEAHIGIDIGSTSTKAALINNNKDVLAGFYTRTSGRPIEAVQSIFKTIIDIEKKNNISFSILSASTTGSGRKLIGRIIEADLILDEISAHARAASYLDKEIDTIIEIGGQDSKFTTLSNGTVTFSIMNTVCAAGTGSFIEEQAKKLGCKLEEYSKRAEGVSAPLASDRCTVFMERDINHYLCNNYTVDEALAAVLHAVCDNYLSKVAIESNIGNKICFQGGNS